MAGTGESIHMILSAFGPLPRFGDIGKEMVRAFTRLEDRYGQEILEEVKTYPPERPDQKYRRTYTFQGEWKASKPSFFGGDILSVIYNNTPYATRVVGNNQGRGQDQRWHAGRWYLFSEVAAKYNQRFADDAQRIIDFGFRAV